MLLLATTCLGIGFGLTVPSLNTFVAAFFSSSVERAVLRLNALLGAGTVLAPVFVALFVALGQWSLLPLLVAVVVAAEPHSHTCTSVDVSLTRPAVAGWTEGVSM